MSYKWSGSGSGLCQPPEDRLFVALEITDEAKASLGNLKSHFSGLKWTPANNLHLTLRFIGLVPQPHIELVQQALRRVKSGSFQLMVTGLGLFHRRGGGILWAGVRREPELLKLKERVDEALCSSAGLSLKAEQFLPHLTLSRLKNSITTGLKAQVQTKASEPFGEISVTYFTLFRSLLRPSGAIHEPVDRYPLAPALTVARP